jgi:ABC-type spermidine/putrescine transport system permease subunit I
MVYQALPYTILVLYPALARLDPTLLEAARTLGASPMRAFFNVVVPALRDTILATLIMVFVFALGSYLLPQILGRPQHWTLSVLITDQAIYQSNMPFAAAMAVFLVLVSLSLVGLTLLIGRRGWRHDGQDLPPGLFDPDRPVLAAPLIVVAGVSVNAKKTLLFPPEGFSLSWYGDIFTESDWRGALVASLVLAALAAALAVAIALPLAWFLWRRVAPWARRSSCWGWRRSCCRR